MRADHCVWDPAAGGLVCRHCHQMVTMTLPIDVRIAADLAESFTRNHRDCKKREDA